MRSLLLGLIPAVAELWFRKAPMTPPLSAFAAPPLSNVSVPPLKMKALVLFVSPSMRVPSVTGTSNVMVRVAVMFWITSPRAPTPLG